MSAAKKPVAPVPAVKAAVAELKAKKLSRIAQLMGVKPDTVISFTLAQLIDLEQDTLSNAQTERRLMRKFKGPQDTIQSLVIAEMRSYWRHERTPLKGFIDAEFDGITITPMDSKPISDKTKKFKIICEGILPPRKNTKVVTLNTLYVWWAEVDKNP